MMRSLRRFIAMIYFVSRKLRDAKRRLLEKSLSLSPSCSPCHGDGIVQLGCFQ